MSLPLLWVALGGGLGAAARFMLSGFVVRSLGATWPLGTLAVNLTGAFLIGFIVGALTARFDGHEAMRLFLVTGVLGGFTTFSAFSLEVALMIERHAWGSALAYALIAVMGTTVLVFAGKFLAETVL